MAQDDRISALASVHGARITPDLAAKVQCPVFYGPAKGDLPSAEVKRVFDQGVSVALLSLVSLSLSRTQPRSALFCVPPRNCSIFRTSTSLFLFCLHFLETEKEMYL